MRALVVAGIVAATGMAAAQTSPPGAPTELNSLSPSLVQPSPVPNGAQQKIQDFDIPAQSLEKALDTYSAAAGIQLLVDVKVVAGLRSTAVKGTFAAPVALAVLIAGTGLAVRAIDGQGVTLVHAANTASASVSRFDRYSAEIQERLRITLCGRPETVPGSYRALMRLWIDSSGIVFRSELVTPTGGEMRDAALTRAMLALTPGQPPAGLPQPVTLLVTPDQAAAAFCEQGEPAPRRDAGLAR
jgi:hypothetical protein